MTELTFTQPATPVEASESMLTKLELMKILEPLPDNTPIFIAVDKFVYVVTEVAGGADNSYLVISSGGTDEEHDSIEDAEDGALS